MSGDVKTMVEQDAADERLGRARYLEYLLSRQLERLRRYDIDGAMSLAEESSQVAQQVAEENVLQVPGNEQLREKIGRLYRDICLTIADERQEVADKLDQVRKGLRTLEKYKSK